MAKYKVFYNYIRKGEFECVIEANSKKELSEKIKDYFLKDGVNMSSREGYYYVTVNGLRLNVNEYGYDLFKYPLVGKRPENTKKGGFEF